jgi:exonuclease III
MSRRAFPRRGEVSRQPIDPRIFDPDFDLQAVIALLDSPPVLDHLNPVPSSGPSLRCLLLNVCSLRKENALDTLLCYLIASNFDVAFLTETWLSSNDVSDAELSRNGEFHVFRLDRKSRGGGVLVLVKSSIACSSVSIEKDDDTELVALDLVGGDQPIRCICVYFSPTGTTFDTLSRMQKLCGLLDTLCETELCTYIVGDFNLPHIEWKTLSCPGSTSVTKEQLFLEFCGRHGFSQHVAQPTRPKSENILDLVLCNDNSIQDVRVISEFMRSDHAPVEFTLKRSTTDVNNPYESRNVPCRYDYRKGDYESIKLNLAATNWFTFFATCPDVNDMYNRLTEYLRFLRSIYVPQVRDMKLSGVGAHVEKLIVMIQRETDQLRLTRLKRDLSKAVRRRRVIDEHRLVKAKNPRRFHNYVSSRMKSKDHLSVLMKDDGTAVTDDAAKAELLRDYFESSYPSQAEVLTRNDNPGPMLTTVRNLNTVESVDTSPENLLVNLLRLKNSYAASPDDLPTAFLKLCGLEVCVPLSLVFERSINDGTLPRVFKQAIVIPVHKKGNKTCVSNKRNVSLTSASCKIFEKIVADTILANATQQGLLCTEQYAYRKGYSCCTQLLTYQNELAHLINNRTPYDVVLFDFKSAFELTTHAKLLECLPTLGVGKKICGWIRDFLTDRSFRVLVNGSFSTEAKITSGCPQGTILGCLAYLMYTNSIKNVFTSDVMYKVYADDTKVYAKVASAIDAVNLQNAIDDFFLWTKQLDLKLSVEKCLVMHCGMRNQRYPYFIDGKRLAQTTRARDLGVIMTPDFCFSEQTREVVLKAARQTNFILRSLELRDTTVYEKLFEMYVLPILTYCSPVWSPRLKRDQALLQSVYDRFRRRVAFKCKTHKDMIAQRNMADIFRVADEKMFSKIVSAPELWNVFFDHINTTSRTVCKYRPKFVAKSEKVNCFFPWRVTKTKWERC